MSAVTVLDCGSGNLLSVCRALAAAGGTPTVSHEARHVAAARRLVLPGVGAFGQVMEGLAARRLEDALRHYFAGGRPFLGICVGMQVMLAESREFGRHLGLGIVPGTVEPIPGRGADGRRHKIPHIGWNAIRRPQGAAWEGTVLDGVTPGAAVYFVHSFNACPEDRAHVLAECDYNGLALRAVIGSGPHWGCQFHPEKSGAVGLAVLRAFLDMR